MEPLPIIIVLLGALIGMIPIMRWCGVIKGVPPTLYPDHFVRSELPKLYEKIAEQQCKIDDLQRELEELKRKE